MHCTGPRHSQQHTRHTCQEAAGGRCIARCLLVSEANEADSCRLHTTNRLSIVGTLLLCRTHIVSQVSPPYKTSIYFSRRRCPVNMTAQATLLIHKQLSLSVPCKQVPLPALQMPAL